MRGKVIPKIEDGIDFRITPAYAGKRSASRGHVEAVRDHPRLCGEKFFSLHHNICQIGSPPPMRGKVRVGEAYSRAYRITPAYAGKSLFL